MSLESLKVLEAKLDEFVDRHEQVREQQKELQQRLEKQATQLNQALAQLKRCEKERVEVRERLQRVLSRINELGLT
jgi:septal ring factor EnvC (AmiA/AmiB activator)